MSQSNPVGRVLGYVLGPLVEAVGRRVERRVRRDAPDPPELPPWSVAVVVGAGMVGAVVVQLLGERESERAEPEPEATAERGTTSESEPETPVLDALETLEVECPPAPNEEDVRASYRRLAVETHPDQGGTCEEFIEVREAWETVAKQEGLSDGTSDMEVTKR